MSAANPVLEGMKTIVLYMNTPEDLAKVCKKTKSLYVLKSQLFSKRLN
jgi:hypothetical protein